MRNVVLFKVTEKGLGIIISPATTCVTCVIPNLSLHLSLKQNVFFTIIIMSYQFFIFFTVFFPSSFYVNIVPVYYL